MYADVVLRRTYEGQDCSIARALEVVGDRWTLLVIRDVGLGRRRFDELQAGLGVATNVLADRLGRLVDEGILERVRYSEKPERFEYRLTEKGAELRVPLLALMQWGDRHLSARPPRVARRRSDGAPVTAALIGPDGELVPSRDLEVVRT
jgi:DNA-binding HxlR family transcriptional regulator